MQAVKINSYHKISHNPLDDLEDMLDASGYKYQRETPNRLCFVCLGKQGEYDLVLEWNSDYCAVKLSALVKATQTIDDTILETAITLANETAWDGFFMTDGVGNSLFKSLVKLDDKDETGILFDIETAIDRAIVEMDRFCISLALTDRDSHQNLFPEEDWSLDNLTLMFSDPKGTA